MIGRCILYDGAVSGRVNRDRLTPIVLGLLAVMALSVSAATLDIAQQGSSQGSSDDTGVSGDGSTFDTGGSQPIDATSADPALVALLRLLFGVVVVLGFVTLLLWVYRKGWRSLLPVVVATVLCVAVGFALYHALSPGSPDESQNGLLGGDELSVPSGSPLPSGDDGSVLSDVTSVVDAPEAALFVLLILAVGIGMLVLNRTTGDSLLEHRSDSDATDPDQSETAAVGAAAGRAADGIDADEPVSNAIYRAWGEMTTHLDLPRETSTPGEFATAAVEVGMAREDVDELTRLFEATRYGDEAVTERREQRALAALRRIEREYASEEVDEI